MLAKFYSSRGALAGTFGLGVGAVALLLLTAAGAGAQNGDPAAAPAAGTAPGGETSGRGGGGSAQQGGNLGLPDAPRNLQVLPADMSTRAVVGVMRGFSGALGVRCIHCHVGDDPSDLSTVDFASDEREAKRVARVMMQMVQTINDEVLTPGLTRVGRTDTLEVRCATCHHGNARPVALTDVLDEAFADDGVDGMVARYDELRAQYYGGWTYDFSEGALLGMAGNLAQRGEMEAAMAAIDKNLVEYPESFSSHITRGQILARAGDMEGAKAAFAACLALNPELGFCQQMIDRIDAQGQQ